MDDRFGRGIDYMRISITDRCNLRCRYCMPEGILPVPKAEVLSFEEIGRICCAAAKEGVQKIKITGGEPLVRQGCAGLVGMLKKISGIKQVTMTTNGILLQECLPQLLENGLDMVNISLDTLQPHIYQAVTGTDGLSQVLAGIRQAVGAGLKTKVNCVLLKGVNDKEWGDLIQLTVQMPLDVRFIEMMPIGHGKGYEPVYNDGLLYQIRKRWPQLEKDTSIHGNGPAEYYKIPGAKGSIGFISAMHGKFCGSCNRLRLTSTGKLKPCLCFEDSIDLMPILRGQEAGIPHPPAKTNPLGPGGQTAQMEALCAAFRQAIQRKPQGHCFETAAQVTEAKQMVQIGG